MLNEVETKVADVGSVGIVIGTLAGYLPDIAALLTVVWAIIRIYETATVQKWLHGTKKEPPHED